jgi:hypothetical protein
MLHAQQVSNQTLTSTPFSIKVNPLLVCPKLYSKALDSLH